MSIDYFNDDFYQHENRWSDVTKLLVTFTYSQCDQIGRFLKVL